MSDVRVERQLAAILAADVAGYSRLMGADEEGTLAALKAHRRELVDPKIDEHRGRIVKTTGDGLLVFFPSAIDAVRCALDVQRGLMERNAAVQPERRIELRIGINVGDVIVEGGDIFGDDVNIAARLEGIAQPGGICVSEDAYRQVRGKLTAAFEDGGEQQLKNIAQPVRVYRLRVEEGLQSSRAPLPLPDKLSIAVLPFTNMSGDSEQEYFADGLSEDIITELSRFRSLFVIARNSSFVYKGRAVDVRAVGRELGVRYVLEGGVRKSGQRLRITAQLVEAATGNHQWAEKYDGMLSDVFELQDNITRAIVATLPGRIEAAYAERIVRAPPKDMAVYELVLAAKVLHHRATKDANTTALNLVERAIEQDPEFAPAYAWRGCLTGQSVFRGFSDGNPRELLKRAFDCVMKGLSLDPNDIECHRVLCEAYMSGGELDRARTHHERAFALNPNDPRIVAQRGELMTWLGEADKAVECLQSAMRLDPFGVRDRSHLLGRTLLAARRYAEAVDAYRMSGYQDRAEQRAELAAALTQVGRTAEAAEEVREALSAKPGFSVAAYVKGLSFAREEDRRHHRDVLLKAGLPA